jgi:hypothetical protein
MARGTVTRDGNCVDEAEGAPEELCVSVSYWSSPSSSLIEHEEGCVVVGEG